MGHSLPKVISEEEVETLIKAPDIKEPIGLRDRAMLELIYACGLRVSELINLDLLNVNLRQGVIRVIGKGEKERLVPMGEESLFWVSEYINRARGNLMIKDILKIGDVIFTGTQSGVGKVNLNDNLKGYMHDKELLSINLK